MKVDKIFLYHLDFEIQKLFGLEKNYKPEEIFECFSSVTKIAYLLCDKSILIPASHYFESDFAYRLLNDIGTPNMRKTGNIQLLSSSYNIMELLDKKTIQHGENLSRKGYHYLEFVNNEKQIYLPGILTKRQFSASKDIEEAWLNRENVKLLGKAIYDVVSEDYKASVLEDKIYQIPNKLGDKAYISQYIVPFFEVKPIFKNRIDNIINAFITKAYIKSFLDEYHAVCMKDIPLINVDPILPQGTQYNHLSYDKYAKKLENITFRGINGLHYVENCNLDQLFEFKFTDTWKRIIEDKEQIEIAMPERMSEMNDLNNTNNVKIGIITALPKECAAMKKMMTDVDEKFFQGSGAGNRFYLGNIQGANGRTHRIALSECGMGNNNAAIRVTNLQSHFPNLQSVIMTGIAGGIPSPDNVKEHIRLGDIVVSTGIIQYDFIKKNRENEQCRSEPPKPSAQLLEAINALQVKEYDEKFEWKAYIDEFAKNRFAKPNIATDILHDENGVEIDHPIDSSRDNYPKVHYGTIASANILLRDIQKRTELKKEYNTYAVEMEASGIADAAWNSGSGYLVIRGICDYCDDFKNKIWQEYAALVAAAYTRNLIENLPVL